MFETKFAQVFFAQALNCMKVIPRKTFLWHFNTFARTLQQCLSLKGFERILNITAKAKR